MRISEDRMEFIKKKSIIGALAVGTAATLWGVDGVYLTPNLYSLRVSYVVLTFHILPFLIMNLFLYKQYGKLKEFSKV